MGAPYIRAHHDGREMHIQATNENIWFHAKVYKPDSASGDYECISVALPKEAARALGLFIVKHTKPKASTP